MARFDQTQQASAEYVYGNMRHYLKKDGRFHVAMVNSFSKWLNQSFECESKYTNQIDTILTHMQDDGFVILDVKFNSIINQGLFGEMEGFHTLISYRYDESTDKSIKRQPAIQSHSSPAPERKVRSAPLATTFINTHACKECGHRVSKEFVEGGYSCVGCGAPNRCLVESPLPDKPEKPESI